MDVNVVISQNSIDVDYELNVPVQIVYDLDSCQ